MLTRSGWLAPLGALYSAAVGAKNAAYQRGWAKPRRLAWPVVSVGNLSVGGAGKTPVVIRLAELLMASGTAVSVLSRGYGRKSTTVEVVDSSGTAAQFGDEPLLMARRLAGARVVVGASRFEAGLLAERSMAGALAPGQRAVHLLDDGFQHRRLARDVDVVVVHRSDFESWLLPAGRLREPLGALRRASVVVLREEDGDLEPRLRGLGVEAPIWWMRRELTVPDAAGGVVAFCGTARPAEFFAALRSAGLDVRGETAFRDHHRYSASDMKALRRLAESVVAERFVTTAKDAVRLDAGLAAQLTGGGVPLRIAELAVSFRDEDAVVSELVRLAGTR